jgi:hypothetical protein
LATWFEWRRHDPFASAPLTLSDLKVNRERGAYFFSKVDIEWLTGYARERWPGQVQAILESADLICRGFFPLVSNVPWDFSRGREWSGPFEDREQLFYLHRFAYASTLAKACLYTGEQRYVWRLVELLRDWGARNPPGDPVSWESYSVAERICSWTYIATALEQAPGFEEFFEGWLAPRLLPQPPPDAGQAGAR